MTGNKAVVLCQRDGLWQGQFQAMASPCEVLIEGGNEKQARRWLKLVSQQAWRIERKYSRYRQDNIVHRINTAQGKPVKLDQETSRLLQWADQAWHLSNGLFDISSGILRQVWHFDGSDQLPSAAEVAALMPYIGWSQIVLQEQQLQMPAGMQLDLGGLGKEYAVDQACTAMADCKQAFLINFGGDLRCSGARQHGAPWQVGVETLDASGQAHRLSLYQGALATSGDAQRFLLKNGQRYSHVLNPQTGWPVTQAPRSVTVAAPSCSEAGLLATLALLQGAKAEAFLQENNAPYWCQR